MAQPTDVEALPEGGLTIPQGLDEKIKRGRERMRDGAAARNEAVAFRRNEQYVYRQRDGYLVSQNTITNPDGSGKPRHRVRTTRNFIADIVEHEKSAATTRTPSYEITASTADPEDNAAAQLAEKVALYGYDKWGIQRLTARVVDLAVVMGEGFAWPYWDSDVGPFMKGVNEKGEDIVIGEGEVAIAYFSPNEVYWEPGIDFDDSPWHVVDQAMTIEAAMGLEGYIGGPLEADASSDDIPASEKREAPQNKLVLVKQYLERPCRKYPEGRWLTIANGKQIVAERPYPCADAEGRPVDEPVLHRLAYMDDPQSERALGLVPFLLDAQRTINDCTNKQLEWKNLALNPQVVIQNGEFKQRLTDEPGAVYHAVGTGQIEWRDVPPIPQELSQIKEEAQNDMARIAAQNDIPPQVESGKGIIALKERDDSRRGNFLAGLAEFHSRLMRHCLYLVQRHYTEPRQLKIRGRLRTYTQRGFMGAQLRGQADVTVLPGSLERRTRAMMEQRVFEFADRGWISPEAAMSAINSSTGVEALLESYDRDRARASEIIQKILDGPEAFLLSPPRQAFPQEQIDPLTGMPKMDENGLPVMSMPSWMPRPFDNVPVQMAVFEDYMKTPDYDALPPPQQEGINAVYSGLQGLKMQQELEKQMQQQQMAEALGAANAAKPQGAKPTPNQARPDEGEEQT